MLITCSSRLYNAVEINLVLQSIIHLIFTVVAVDKGKGGFCAPGDICQCLKTFWVVIPGPGGGWVGLEGEEGKRGGLLPASSG